MNEWLKHVRAYQAKHICSYKQALQQASKTYKKQKGAGTKPATGAVRLADGTTITQDANTPTKAYGTLTTYKGSKNCTKIWNSNLVVCDGKLYTR